WDFHQDVGDLGRQMQDMGQELGDAKQGMIHDAVEKAHEAVVQARGQARRAVQQAQMGRTRNDGGTLSTTRIDLAKAQIVFSDDQGEMRIDSIEGKRVLTAKDPQGRLLFSGPVETKEDLDKMPPDLRKRFEKLQEKDLPSTVQPAASP